MAQPPASRTFFNPFPKYLQVRQALERRLAGYGIGEQTPTEQALCAEFGVSRQTVREALRGLEADGILERRRPTGTFLARHPAKPLEEKLTGMAEDFTALHLNTKARVLSADRVSEAGDAVFRIRRLRDFDDQPLALHEADLPPAIGAAFTRAELTKSPIALLLDGKGIRYMEERHQIEATVADTELAQLLKIAIGAPVLLVVRHLRLGGKQGRIVFRSWYRADRYRYTVELSRLSRRSP